MLASIDHVLYEALPFVPLALGLVLTLRYLKFVDLTAAAAFSLGPAVVARLVADGHPIALGVAAAIVLTFVLVALTAVLMIGLKLDSLLAGVIATYAGYAVALYFTRGSLTIHPAANPLSPLKELDFQYTAGVIPLHPWSIAAFLAVAVILKWMLDRVLDSEFGLAFRALEDPRGAEHFLPSLGLSPARMMSGALTAAALLAMTSGILIALKEGQANAQRGFDSLLTAVAAYLIGTSLFERRLTVKRSTGQAMQILSALQHLRPTGAATSGVLLYFALLQFVAGQDLNPAVPRLVLAALLVLALMAANPDSVTSFVKGRSVGTTVPVDKDQPLKANNVTVSYPGPAGPLVVVEGASLSIAPGSIQRIQGPNGSGKTTLLRFLAGELEGTGSVMVPATAAALDRRQLIAYINQDPSRSTIATLTPREHLALVSHHGTRSALRKASLDTEDRTFSFLPDQPAAMLSGGQRQVLSLKCVLHRAHPPRVLLLDEPFNHLDTAHARQCRDLLDLMLAEHRAIGMVWHQEAPTLK